MNAEPVPHGATGGQPEPALLLIGDIVVSEHWVRSPTGVVPLAGTTWIAVDRTYLVRKTATWGIICAVVLFFVIFVLSLLFLLAKEDQPMGFVEVTVRSADFAHTVTLPATTPAGTRAFADVQYAQQLAWRAGQSAR